MVKRQDVPRTVFGTKLDSELRRQNLSVRALARRMNPADPEGMRRSIARWLAPVEIAVNPNAASRRVAEEALGLEPYALDDEEEDADLLQALSTVVRRLVEIEVAKARREKVAA